MLLTIQNVNKRFVFVVIASVDRLFHRLTFLSFSTIALPIGSETTHRCHKANGNCQQAGIFYHRGTCFESHRGHA